MCSTSSDELLVVIVNDNNNQTKIVRYSGSTETQSIQFDDKGKPLFSATGNSDFPQCICENTNLDICVADIYNNAVVVVNQNGEFRFRYAPSELFYPVGIATDSQSRILISGRESDIIHIVDQDGYYLRYISNCYLQSPWGLCLDTKDNLFVAESATGKVKKIKYCM